MSDTTHEITNGQDVIDSRDVTERRVALLKKNRRRTKDELNELVALTWLRTNCWHAVGKLNWEAGVMLVRDSYFVEYTKEMVEGIYGEMPGYLVIDWNATATAVRTGYVAVEVDGVTYWVR